MITYAPVRMLCKIPSKIYGYFFEKEKVWKSFVDHVAWEEYFLNPPINYTFKSKADLWHITNYIPDDISHNFVIDLEHPFMLSGDSYNYKKIIENKENIEAKLSSKYCKKILPLSEGAKEELLYYLDLEKNVIDKIEVVYPSITPKTNKIKKFLSNELVTFLHVGNKFYGKETRDLIESIKILDKECRRKFICHIVSNDLRDVNYDGDSIIWHKNISYKKLYYLYDKAHVFVLPLLQDSFGVYLECLAFGMPMISTGIYDKKEIIFDNYNGLIIKAPYSLLSHDDIFKKWNNWDEFCNYVKNNLDSDFIKQIYQKMEYFIENKNEVERMSKNMFNVLSKKFSTELKNKKLRRIYHEILS